MIPKPAVVAILAAAAIVASWPVFLPVLYETHDGHYAIYNAAQFDAALRDGQLPVRWLPDLFGGRGIPHFVFYHPLAFYLTSLLHAVGLGFIAAVKSVYVLSALIAGGAMFALLEERVERGAALAGAVAYVLAPYHLVEIHVKGDPPASLALALAPLLLLAVSRAARGGTRAIALLGLASAALVTAHALGALLTLPLAAAWILVEAPRPAPQALARIGAGVGLGASLSAFQWLSALAEKRFVHIDSPLGILFFDYREHFLAAWQWLSPLWGYHGSFAGTRDDMAFQVGPLHAAAILAALAVARREIEPSRRRVALWGLASVALALALTLPASRVVWDALPPMKLIQFPWRWLAPASLAASALLALAVDRLPARVVVTGAAAAPPLVTAVFAATTGNRWYGLMAAAYALAGGLAWSAWRLAGARDRAAPLAVAVLLATTALPWSAVPLHAAYRGEPKIVTLDEADLASERVRLGIRRTAARDDYLPRTVAEIPPRDPAQEFLPPAGVHPSAEFTVSAGLLRVEGLRRRSSRWDLEVLGGGRLTLELHDFPGWVVTIGGSGASAAPLPHGHDTLGRIVIEVPDGGPRVLTVRYARTRDRAIGEAATCLGAIVTLALLAFPRRRAAATIR